MMKSAYLLAVLAWAGISGAQAQSLPLLADGKAWVVTAPEGMTMEMTFYPDGRGQMQAGFISREMSWSMKDGAFCLEGLPVAAKCMTLSARGKDVVGTATDDGVQLVFRRV